MLITKNQNQSEVVTKVVLCLFPFDVDLHLKQFGNYQSGPFFVNDWFCAQHNIHIHATQIDGLLKIEVEWPEGMSQETASNKEKGISLIHPEFKAL